MGSVVISERIDIGKQWFQVYMAKGVFSGGTSMFENDVLMNVWKQGLKVTKVS